MHILERKKIKLFVALVGLMLVSATMLSSCEFNKKGDLETVSDLNKSKYIIAAGKGAAAGIMAEESFPDATVIYEPSTDRIYESVSSGEADAAVYSKPVLEYNVKHGKVKGMSVMDETIGKVDIAVGISPGREAYTQKINSFIDKLKDDGIYNNMYTRWFVTGDESMPDIPQVKNSKETLKIATSGELPPTSFYNDSGELVGFDVELAKRLAYYLGFDYEIVQMDFLDSIEALQSGEVDLIVGNLNITDERKKLITMSKPYMTEKTGVLVRTEELKNGDLIRDVEDLDGKIIGVEVDAIYVHELEEEFPNSTIVYYEEVTDLNQALKSNQIDAYAYDNNVVKRVISNNIGTEILEESVVVDNCVFMLGKDSTELRDEINGVIAKYKKDGTIEALEKKWFEGEGDPQIQLDDNKKFPNGVLHIGVVSDKVPISYMENGKHAGYEVELICKIAEDLGYKPKISNYSLHGLISSVNSKQSDVIVGALAVSKERAKAMSCTDVVYESHISLVVNSERSRVDGIKQLPASFHKTFIEAERWKMILKGLGATFEISIIAIILGTILGYFLSFPLRSRNKLISRCFNTVSLVLESLPLLITLMIFYYIIFAGFRGGATFVAILTFVIYFSNNVANILNAGIGAVNKGEIEAAYAMGYSRRLAFKKIIFPQAAHFMFGQYTAAVTGLIKGTSIVGFIAVVDLTRAVDIIRAHTYEAFFPIVVSAVIYFIIARVVILLFGRIAKKINPKEKTRAVEGVKIND